MHDRQPPEDEAVRGHCVEHPGQWEHRTQETGGEAEQGSDGHNPANKRPSNLQNNSSLLSCTVETYFILTFLNPFSLKDIVRSKKVAAEQK